METELNNELLHLITESSEEKLDHEKNTASSVINRLLKSLCLEEFPCGRGSWRGSGRDNVDDIFQTTTKNYNLQHEKIEVLSEYLNSGTWDVDTSWSNEVESLRKIAVQTPYKITSNFVHSYFKSLRLISKQITEVDSEILKFKNLEELTLTVNKLTCVPASLPPKIKILELSTNDIDDLSNLQSKKFNFLHLGLSYNLLSGNSQHKYLTGEIFPKLMSLDLSYNNLTDLVELIEKCSLLPCLKNLTLLGNPLSLLPGYRGFVIDSLRSLQIFDDHHVTADEKHHFKGLARRKESVLDEAYLNVNISSLKGLPMPEELIDDPDRPEFPIVSTSYFIQYRMISSSGGGDEYEENHTGVLDFDTAKKEWDENFIDFEYDNLHNVDNLTLLKELLINGITFSIIEQRIESRPMSPEDGTQDAVPDSPKKKDKSGKNTPAAKKGKETPKGKDKTDKGKKKTKSVAEDLQYDPPVFKTIGSYTITTDKLIDGETNVDCSCYCGGGPIPEVTIADSPDDLTKPSVAKLTRKKSLKSSSDKKSANGKKAKQEPPPPMEEDEPPKPPPPILLHVKIELKTWSTAADSLKPFS